MDVLLGGGKVLPLYVAMYGIIIITHIHVATCALKSKMSTLDRYLEAIILFFP